MRQPLQIQLSSEHTPGNSPSSVHLHSCCESHRSPSARSAHSASSTQQDKNAASIYGRAARSQTIPARSIEASGSTTISLTPLQARTRQALAHPRKRHSGTWRSGEAAAHALPRARRSMREADTTLPLASLLQTLPCIRDFANITPPALAHITALH